MRTLRARVAHDARSAALRAPALFVGVIHVLSVVALVVVNHALLTSFEFSYAVTLTALQYAAIALSLSFWALFGMLRMKRVPFSNALRLAIGASICSALSNLSLRFNSLAAFQATRMVAAPLVLALEVILGVRSPPRRTRTVFVAGVIVIGASAAVAALDNERSKVGVGYAVAAVVASALYQVISMRLRLTTRANELQLQLYTKALGAAALMPLAPFVDNFSASSPRSILYFEFEEPVSALLLVSSFLAFLSFAAQRASISLNPPSVYNTLAYCVSALILATHFTSSIATAESRRVAAVQLASACAVVAATLLFAYARDSSIAKGPPPSLPVALRSHPEGPAALRAIARASRGHLNAASSSSNILKGVAPARAHTAVRLSGHRRGTRSDTDITVAHKTVREMGSKVAEM